MILPLAPESRVGKFWDYPIEKVNDNTFIEIRIIVAYREKALNKVRTNEWTEEEYNHFATALKKVIIKRFVEFIEIADYLL